MAYFRNYYTESTEKLQSFTEEDIECLCVSLRNSVFRFYSGSSGLGKILQLEMA